MVFYRPNAATDAHACEVESWCPIEVDQLPNGRSRALMAKAEEYTVFVKNSVAFPYFGPEYVRSNLVGNGGKACLYERKGDNYNDLNNGCQIFRLGDMVRYAGGNFAQ